MSTEPNTPNPTSNPNVQQQGEPSRKLAFASLILGIIGVSFLVAGISIGLVAAIPGLLPALPAVICGHKAISREKKYPSEYGGRGMAIMGLILGYIMCAISLFLTVGYIIYISR
jgi:hypothetical protein